MLYIDVPFHEKDEAKKLGAWWDAERKKWYVKNRKDYPKFIKWILKDEEEVYILCDHFYIVVGTRQCYRCRKDTEVIAFGVEQNIVRSLMKLYLLTWKQTMSGVIMKYILHR